jgi:alginate O-acetyltransferase complex protein AlgI
MLFCTTHYVLFLGAVLALFWLTPWRRGRVWVLLIASFAFYAAWNEWLAALVLATATADFAAARVMGATSRWALRRVLLIASLGMNLGLLCYFKYVNFFLDSLTQGLHAVGAEVAFPTLSVILPIGISFYTFEAINYTVDVYRGKILAERRLDHFLLFILFFPHLIAGPIVRAADFLPQIERPKQWSWSRVGLGLGLLALGTFKKLAIADRMAAYADPVFAAPDMFSTAACWVGAVAFAVQVYCDFSGYSDMALGSAQLLGYKLVVNFRLPFLAVNVADFWRRWHVSLSEWLKDYVFIPLGGSRKGIVRANANLMATMVVCGLWHGANWPYVVFGMLQGLLLIGHRLFVSAVRPFSTLRTALQSRPGTAGRIVLTFAVFCVTVAVFRSLDLASAWTLVNRLLIPRDGRHGPLELSGFWLTLALVAVGHAVGWHVSRSPFAWKRTWLATPAPVLGVLGASAIVLGVVLAPGATKAFIYFQF